MTDPRPLPTTTVFVLAGNHEQFRDFCRSLATTTSRPRASEIQLIYLRDIGDVYGRSGDLRFVRVGTWRSNPNRGKLEWALIDNGIAEIQGAEV